MIHFQWEQEGACLRATDLKPRLDRYIRKKYNLPEENRLPYQVKIRPYSIPESPSRRFHKGLYFADIGDDSEKKALYFKENLSLEFNTYFSSEIKEMIEETLPLMLALENFGTRNNKGLGCFFQANKDRNYFEDTLKETLKTEDISNIFYWECCDGQIYDSIYNLYTCLKSGINHNGYVKSILCQYFLEKGIRWEKRALKHHFDMFTHNEQPEFAEKEYYVRALFGLASNQSWHSKHDNELTVQSDEFARIPSPLVFKIFIDSGSLDRVYFFAKSFYKDVLNKEFTFKFKRTSKSPIKLLTPPSFDMNDFLNYVQNNYKNFKINSL